MDKHLLMSTTECTHWRQTWMEELHPVPDSGAICDCDVAACRCLWREGTRRPVTHSSSRLLVHQAAGDGQSPFNPRVFFVTRRCPIITTMKSDEKQQKKNQHHHSSKFRHQSGPAGNGGQRYQEMWLLWVFLWQCLSWLL